RLNPRPETYLYIAWLGTSADYFKIRELERAFSVIVDEPEKFEVVVTDYTASGDFQRDNAMKTRFQALITMGEIDAIITSRQGVEEFIEGNMFLQTVDEILNFFHVDEEKFFFAEEKIFAVSLEGSQFLKNVEINSDDNFLCVIVNSKRFHELAKALEVLLNGA
ncbi:MAG: hypothetical protein FWD19_04875, partial [Defluviitaleaceae bacterium]|nr:hypothetical protein [Defluviitaleaceae bacterium]